MRLFRIQDLDLQGETENIITVLGILGAGTLLASVLFR
jgi:hypothetical protein